MEAYLNHYERPPPNRLVTRQLESEKSYDEAAWSDDYWEETLAKRKEIADVLDSNKKPMLSPKPPANVFPSTDIRQRKKDKLSKEPSDLSNLGKKNLQTHEPVLLLQRTFAVYLSSQLLDSYCKVFSLMIGFPKVEL